MHFNGRINTLMMTRWSACPSIRASPSAGNESSCCRMHWAIAGTKVMGFKSRSSQSTSANCSGVINVSIQGNKEHKLVSNIHGISNNKWVPFLFQVNVSRNFCPSISMSRRMGTNNSGWLLFSWTPAGSVSSKLEIGREKWFWWYIIGKFIKC